MSSVYWLFTAIIGLFAYAGARAGVRACLVKILAGLGALVLSSLLTPLLLKALLGLINPIFVWFWAGLLIFFATGVLLNRVLTLWLAPLCLPARWDTTLGALLNAVVGTVVAGLCIWCLTVVGGLLRLMDNKPTLPPHNQLQQAAAWGIQQMAEVSGRAGGLPLDTARLWGAIAAYPVDYLADAKAFVLQPAYLQVLQAPNSQALLQPQAFLELKQQPLVQQLQQSQPWQAAQQRLMQAGVQQAEARLFHAFAVFSRGLLVILMDAQIKQFWLQPQVRLKIAEGDYLGLSMHPQFQPTLERAEFLVKNLLSEIPLNGT